jgi:hypothetical protein
MREADRSRRAIQIGARLRNHSSMPLKMPPSSLEPRLAEP